MENLPVTPLLQPESPRQYIQRQRSNSFPIVEALGCSTPEAQLILAEGRAAVRKRQERSRRNRSVNDESIITFDPRDHLKYLETLATLPTPQERPYTSEGRGHHARIPSDATDMSTSTIVAPVHQVSNAPNDANAPTITSPLGDYSANLALFIKAQLKSIPTYTAGSESVSPLSPRSCPELFYPGTSPLSPRSPNRIVFRRPAEAPNAIVIPAIHPPMRSAFSAWSSTDDETDYDDDEADKNSDGNSNISTSHNDNETAYPLLGADLGSKSATSKGSSSTPSLLGYYEHSNTSFLFSSTPLEEDESDPDTAKAPAFPVHSSVSGDSISHEDHGYPSSSLSQSHLTLSSAPSNTSSASISSYFDCKRSIAITSHMKDRIIAAVTPSLGQSKTLTAISPWEGGVLANVHDVFVESQQRVHVDGMSFDMVRDFVVPNTVTTPG